MAQDGDVDLQATIPLIASLQDLSHVRIRPQPSFPGRAAESASFRTPASAVGPLGALGFTLACRLLHHARLRNREFP